MATRIKNGYEMKFIVERLFLYCFCLSATLALAGEGEYAQKPASVASLSYGVSLFHYYQEQYLDAMTELAVAQKRGGMKGHALQSKLMMGSMALNYGMQRYAANIFDEVLAQSVEPAIVDQVWFYFGKISYQQGQVSSAQNYFEKVGEQLSLKLQPEWRYLQTLSLIELGQLEQAALPWLERVELNPDGEQRLWRAYAYYNLAVAYHRVGVADKARHFMDSALDSIDRTVEGQYLRQRIELAKGYLLLVQNDLPQAFALFQSFPLYYYWREPALLGLGWAAYRQKNYTLALQAWQVLADSPPHSLSVQEAYLGIANVYEQMAYSRQALNAYQAAEEIFTQTHDSLDLLEQQLLRQKSIYDWFVDDIEGYNASWLSREASLNIKQADPLLARLAVQHRFQAALSAIRDLRYLQRQLRQWHDS